MVDEDPEEDLEHIVDWLCWTWARRGEHNFPPDNRAEECIERLDLEAGEAQGKEYGAHSEKYITARERFHDMEKYGLDPKARAERYIEESDLDLPDIDWEWLNA